ncbi:MAG: D-alanine--D-alanine ligase [Bacteroidales bacterium]|nr:D-alanine--D-alanine ligase [Bacteroidales bacterium]
MEIKTIAVIYGSDSSEWEVSCRSGEFTASRIDGHKFDVYEIFARFGEWQLVAYRKKNSMRVILPENERPVIDKSDFSVTVGGGKVKFDYAYIMQHGTPGENGLMQGYLEMLGVPHSGCNAFVSAITFDKFSCKSYLKDVDFVKCADDIFMRKGESLEGKAQKAVEKLGLPMFVKPTDGGSSFGVTKVKTVEDFDKAVEYAFSEGNMLIAEAAVVGRELTCAVYYNGKENVALPVIEIITENEFFDYEAKYNGHSKEVCPAQIPDSLRDQIQEVSKKIYAHLGCSGLVRVDYISSEDGLYFLEVNTIPGMTAASLVPQMVRASGMDMTDFLTTIIENS